MTQRTFQADLVRAAIQDYLDGSATLQVLAGQFEVSEQKFLEWCELDRQFRAKEKMIKPIEPATFKLREVMPNTGYKTRKHLTAEERQRVYEARKAGGTVDAVATRFGISGSTVINITQSLKLLEKEKEIKAKPQALTVLEPIALNKILDSSDTGVFFEDDYMVIRIPKKNITKELLKGLL